MEKINIGTYAFGMDSGMTLGEKMKKAAELGYTGVELLAVDLEQHSVEELKAMLADSGLECVSLHAAMDLISGLIPPFAELGGKMIICPMYPFADKEEALELARLLEEKAAEAKPYGLKIGYHNHTSEFFPVEGKPLLEYVIENTGPGVYFQLDCGWATAAGVDCPAFIAKYSGRFCSVHVKENNKVSGPDQPVSAKEPRAPRLKLEMDAEGKPILTEEMKKRIAAMGERTRVQCPMGDPSSNIDWKAIQAATAAQGIECAWTVEREHDYAGDNIKCLAEDCAWLKANIPD